MVSEWGKVPSFVFAGVILHAETLIYNTTWKKIVDEDVIRRKGAETLKCTAPEKMNIWFSENCVVDFTVLCINDKRKLCNNRNIYKQQKENLFCNLF